MKLKPNKPVAIALAKKLIPELVADACQLEQINFTVPEIQTLLGGTTVGGRSLVDQHIAVNQINAWRFLINEVEKNNFALTKDFSLHLHNIAAKEDALEWGQFRSGIVTIAGTSYTPPQPDFLDGLYDKMLEGISEYPDPIDAAVFIFLTHAKAQFFYDNNKRQGRFLMNAMLLSGGLPAISVPKKSELEFNENMLRFYDDDNDDQREMNEFLRLCINERLRDEFGIDLTSKHPILTKQKKTANRGPSM